MDEVTGFQILLMVIAFWNAVVIGLMGLIALIAWLSDEWDDATKEFIMLGWTVFVFPVNIYYLIKKIISRIKEDINSKKEVVIKEQTNNDDEVNSWLDRLVDNKGVETNPKAKNSSFLSMLHSVRSKY